MMGGFKKGLQPLPGKNIRGEINFPRGGVGLKKPLRGRAQKKPPLRGGRGGAL